MKGPRPQWNSSSCSDCVVGPDRGNPPHPQFTVSALSPWDEARSSVVFKRRVRHAVDASLNRLTGSVRQGIFLPESKFQCGLSFGVPKPRSEIACIYICAHVKDPVVHVGVRWIMETLKHPACIWDWVERLSQLAFSGEGNPNCPWEKSHWDNTVVKSKFFMLAPCSLDGWCAWSVQLLQEGKRLHTKYIPTSDKNSQKIEKWSWACLFGSLYST